MAGPSRAFSLAVAGLLLASLAALAALQWRWIGEVSALDRQRLHSSLIGAGARFTEDFDREVTRAFLTFLPADGPADPRQRVVSQLERWQDEAPYPGLISELYLAGGPAPALGPAGELALLNLAERRFEERPWPNDLIAAAQLRRPRSSATPALQRFLLPELPGLRVPLASAELAALHELRRRGEAEADAPEAAAPRGQLLLRFDTAAIAGQILPELTRRHFGSAEGTDYAVLVTAASDPERVFFRSDPDLALSEFGDADIRLELFSLRLFPDLHDPAAGTAIRWRFGHEREGAGSGRHRGHRQREGPEEIVQHHATNLGSTVEEGVPPPAGPPAAGRLRRLRLDGGEGGGGWVLAVKRRDGSLEQAVGAIRRRNLAVSSGILAVLLITTGTLMVTAQRARRLARQQIEFVAGVTHELHTPLTAIRSAGENLADGVVSGPEQVRRYGRLIEGEGRRLSGMVGQLLELAGIQSGRRNYRMEPTAVAAIVEGALADSRWLLAEARVEVEREIADGLPPVNGDLSALKRALQNLIENAVKYGGETRWLRVEARLGNGRGEVEIAVADRGPGIPAADLPHLFEPFYRGSAASSANVPGSGLGLALVRHVAEAHGGGVRVEGAAGGATGTGSVFVLHLPAAERGGGEAGSPSPAAGS